MAANFPAGNDTALQAQPTLPLTYGKYMYIFLWIKFTEFTEVPETYYHLHDVNTDDQYIRTLHATGIVTSSYYSTSNSGVASLASNLGGTTGVDDLRDADLWGDGEWHLMTTGGQIQQVSGTTGRLAHGTWADGVAGGGTSISGGDIELIETGPDLFSIGSAGNVFGSPYAQIDGAKIADVSIVVTDTAIDSGTFAEVLTTDIRTVYGDDVKLYWQLGSSDGLNSTLSGGPALSNADTTPVTFDDDLPSLTRPSTASASASTPITVSYPIQQSGFNQNSVDETIIDYRATRLTVSSPNSSATKTQWEINLGGDNFYITTIANTPAAGSVLGGSKTYLDYWFPPAITGTVRYRQFVSGSWEAWSDLVSFTALGYINSYEKYQILNRNTITVS